jgi:hypothetical protein
MSLRIRCLYRSRESDARKRDERADVASNFDESWKADRFSLYAIGRARSSQMVERVAWRVKFVPAVLIVECVAKFDDLLRSDSPTTTHRRYLVADLYNRFMSKRLCVAFEEVA